MERAILTCLSVLSLALAPCHAKEKQHAPLSPQLLTAKTAYIENQATADIADRVYDELRKWGRFAIVTDKAKADLVLRLSTKSELRMAQGTGHTRNYTHLEALDPRTEEVLYSDVQKSAGSTIRELRKRIEAQESQRGTGVVGSSTRAKFNKPHTSSLSQCLPSGIKLDDIVSAEYVGYIRPENIVRTTVEQTLAQLNAICRNDKLVDASGKEIYFYHLIGCWGTEAPDYHEALQKQRDEISKLKQQYTVVEMTCNPSGIPIP